MKRRRNLDQIVNGWFNANPRARKATLWICLIVCVGGVGFGLGGSAGGAPLPVQIPMLLLLFGIPIAIAFGDHVRPALGARWRARWPNLIGVLGNPISVGMVILWVGAGILGYLSADHLNPCPTLRPRCF